MIQTQHHLVDKIVPHSTKKKQLIETVNVKYANMVIIGPLIIPEEGLVKKLENVEMKINQTQMNAGTLYITEK